MVDAIFDLFDSGVFETVVLMLLLIMLVINEVLSGIELDEVVRLRGMVQLCTIPLGICFVFLAGLRIVLLL